MQEDIWSWHLWIWLYCHATARGVTNCLPPREVATSRIRYQKSRIRGSISHDLYFKICISTCSTYFMLWAPTKWASFSWYPARHLPHLDTPGSTRQQLESNPRQIWVCLCKHCAPSCGHCHIIQLASPHPLLNRPPCHATPGLSYPSNKLFAFCRFTETSILKRQANHHIGYTWYSQHGWRKSAHFSKSARTVSNQVCALVQVYIYIHLHMCVHEYINIYIHSVTLTCSLTYKLYTFTYAHIRTFTHKHTHIGGGIIEYSLNK